jgi:serine/threonine protein kinase
MYKLMVIYRIIKRYIYLKIKYNIFKKFNIRIGSYDDISGGFRRIAFIDQDGMIHCEDGYEKYFHSGSLYKGGGYLTRTKFEIFVLLQNNKKLLVEKKFNNRTFEFYNEMFILNILKDFDFVPNIEFVSYKKNILYLEYFNGCTLREKLVRSGAKIRDIDLMTSPLSFEEKAAVSIKFLYKSIDEKIISIIKNKYKKINLQNIIMHDIKYGNIILNNNDVFLIDFETSIYFPELPRFLFKNMKKIDENKIETLFPENFKFINN